LHGPAFRLPTEVQVSWTADKVSLQVSKPTRIRLNYGLLRPEWTAQDRLVLQRRRSENAADIVRDDIVWKGNSVEWQAIPGAYELLRLAK
jgi:hypothetical protein